MPSPTEPSTPSQRDADLDVLGAFPPGLAGRVVGIDPDGVIHSVLIGDGRASYSGRRLRTETVVHDVVDFGGSMLVFGDDSPAYELGAGGDTPRMVDLAGHGRSLAAAPKHDAATGELHLIAHDTNGLQAYVVVSAGALTRRSRPLPDAPRRIRELAISRDHAVLVADGFVGVAPRNGELRTTWIPTGLDAAHPAHAHDVGDTVVVLALTPLLERWTLHPGAGRIRREVLDPTPRRSIHCGIDGADGTPRSAWTTGHGTIGHHVLAEARHDHHSLRPTVPGDLVFVADATRELDTDRGWLVGFVHHPSAEGTELRVIDVIDIVEAPLATAAIPRLVPPELRCTWIPSTRR
jgi:carotenoid cleavage dioxygenase-like enzyme